MGPRHRRVPFRVEGQRPPRLETPREPLAALARLFPTLLILAAFAAYANSFSVPYIFDDLTAIEENPYIERLLPLERSLAAPPQSSLAGRPAVSFSFALNYAFGGRSVGGCHLVNLAIHVLAALALFGVVRRTLTTTRMRETWGRSPTGIAMASSLLWMLHPIQTASVTYIVQRAESMMALCYLLTLYCFIRSAKGNAQGGRIGWLTAAVAASLLGMSSKEAMATAPAAILFYDRVFLSRSWEETLRRRGLAHAALWGTLLLLVVLVAGGPRSGSAGFGLKAVTSLDYARAQFGIILHYLRLSLIPYPLVLDYDWPPMRSWGPALAPMAGVIALLGVAIWALWRHPAAGYAAFCFFLILAPTSTVVPIADLAFEHRMYLPLAALVVLATSGGAALLRRMLPDEGRRLRTSFAIVAAIALVYAGLTLQRNSDFRTPESVWRGVIARRPANPRGYNNLGMLLNASQKYQAALPLLRTALALKRDYADAHYNLGNALAHTGEVDGAMAEYRRTLEIDPGYWKAQNNLGGMLFAKGQLDAALQRVDRALEFNPGYPDAHNNRGSILATGGRFEEAIREYATALRLKPDYAEARENLLRAQEQLRLRPAPGR